MSNTLSFIIEQRIYQHFSPTYYHLHDDSDAHAGHIGSAGGGKHFSLTIHSAIFKDMAIVKRHQSVYAVLQDLMDNHYALSHPTQGYIHALQLHLQVH